MAAARSAFAATGRPAPRRPWPEPLPTVLPLTALRGGTASPLGPEEGVGPDGADGALGPDVVLLGLADDPDRQRQHPVGWDRAAGNLLLLGVGGSGTTTTLRSIALALAAQQSPQHLHLHVLDAGAGELADLADLPHAGSVVGPTETERQVRLVGLLRAELDRRREAGAAAVATAPEWVVLLDGWSAFAAGHEGTAGLDLLDSLARVFADGPEVGIRTVVAADRPGAVPSALAAARRASACVLRLADPFDYAAIGLRDVPPLPPGRAVRASDGRLVQLGLARPGGARRRARLARPGRRRGTPAGGRAPRPGRPRRGAAAADPGPGRPRPRDRRRLRLRLRVGRPLAGRGGGRRRRPRPGRAHPARGRARDRRRPAPQRSQQHPAHARPRSAPGRRPGSPCWPSPSVAPRSGRAPGSPRPPAPRRRPRRCCARWWPPRWPAPTLLLVDDADTVDDPDGLLALVVARRDPALHVAVAGRPDALRSQFGHWTAGVRKHRVGVLLRPDVDLDGDLLGVRLPRRAAVPWRPGRGYLVVDGEPRLTQVALAD